MKINRKTAVITGILGALGGLVLFAGDMLYYYHPHNTDILVNMGNASGTRLLLSAVTALLATWLYLAGTVQIYYAFGKSPGIVRNIIVICFAAIFTAYGIIHGAYLAIATSAKLAVANNLDPATATHLAIYINNVLRMFVYPVFAVLSLLFIYYVWKGKSLYPSWMILFFPLLPFLLREIIVSNTGGKYKIIIGGGYYNLILVIFFIASTIAIIQNKRKAL